MATIEQIRETIDQHLALHVVVLGAQADLTKANTDAREALESANNAFNTAEAKAKKALEDAMAKAIAVFDAIERGGEDHQTAAQLKLEAAMEAFDAYREKAKEEGIELPRYDAPIGGGHTRL